MPGFWHVAAAIAFGGRLLLIGWLLTGNASAAEPVISVIVRSGAAGRSYSAEEVENIFRRRQLFSDDGTPLVPVNLPLAHPVREAFSRAVFKLEPEEMEAYWNERYFHGISPPYVVASIEAMLRFVATTDGAVGYVLDCQVDERVATVMTLPIAAPDPELRAFCGGPEPIPNLQTELAH